MEEAKALEDPPDDALHDEPANLVEEIKLADRETPTPSISHGHGDGKQVLQSSNILHIPVSPLMLPQTDQNSKH